eukprot:2468646-Rhodomonas_salina.2
MQLLGAALLLKWSFLPPGAAAEVELPPPVPHRRHHYPDHQQLPVLHRALAAHHQRLAPPAGHARRRSDPLLLGLTVLAPRTPASLWSFLRGRSGAPWSEPRDICIEHDVSLYVQGRVERGARVGAGAQLAAFTRIDAFSHVQPTALIAGNPSMRIDNKGGHKDAEQGYSGVGWSRVVGSAVLLVVHRCFVTTVIALGIHVEKELLGAGSFGERRVWLGAAADSGADGVDRGGGAWRDGAVQVGGVGASEGRGDELRELEGAAADARHHDVGPVATAVIRLPLRRLRHQRCPLPLRLQHRRCPRALHQPALRAVPRRRAHDHRGRRYRITLAPTKVSAGAVVHPLAGLFISSLGPDATLYPRAKSLREMTTGEAETWVGMPAYRAECEFVDEQTDTAVPADHSATASAQPV